MRVRHVGAGDWERVKALRLRALREDPQGFSSTYEREAAYPDAVWSSRAALSEAGEEQRMYVVTEDGEAPARQAVGDVLVDAPVRRGMAQWLGMALARDDAGTAVLNAMWVAPEGRGRGAARALCDACADWAKTRGFDVLEVGVYPDNEPARGMYAAAGFAPGRLEDGILILTRAL